MGAGWQQAGNAHGTDGHRIGAAAIFCKFINFTAAAAAAAVSVLYDF